MFTRIALAGASLAMLTGAALTTAGPAMADSAQWYFDAGYGQFASVGEILKACDENAEDDATVAVQWRVEENPAIYGRVADRAPDGVCSQADLNIADGQHILYRVCIRYYQTGVDADCTWWVRDTA